MIKIIILIIGVLNLINLYKRKKIASSSSIWIICYLLIFVIYPIYSDDTYNNSSLIDILALIGIIIFSIGRFFGKKIVFKKRNNNIKKYMIPGFKISLLFFSLFFIISLYFLNKYIGAQGVLSILKGTLTSKKIVLNDNNSNSITFSMHLLVPCILSMWITSKNGTQKIISAICMLVYITETILFGFTRIFLISILAIILFYEIRNLNNKKQIIVVSIVGCSLVLLLVFMNFIRSLGLSNYVSFRNYINIDYIFESTDFGASYRWFDSLLNYEPMYINPVVYLKPFLVFIPRSIWITKPEPLSLQILREIDPFLANSGYSTAGNSVLGEGYALLGYFGMFFNCFLWGFICEKLDNRYQKRLIEGNESNLLNIYYYIFAVFIVISGQRGDWSQYMTIVLWFYFLPMYLFSLLHTKRYNRRVL